MGMILLAGVGAAAIFRFLRSLPILWSCPMQAVAAVVLAVGAGHLAWQAYQLNFNPRYLASPENPYVYAHTPTRLPELAARLDRLAARIPGGRDLPMQVVVTDNYWPLPWYLRKFNERRVGYWLDAKEWKRDFHRYELGRADRQAAILIVSSDVDCDDPALHIAEYSGPYYDSSLRPGVLLAVYLRKDLWPAYLECMAEK